MLEFSTPVLFSGWNRYWPRRALHVQVRCPEGCRLPQDAARWLEQPRPWGAGADFAGGRRTAGAALAQIFGALLAAAGEPVEQFEVRAAGEHAEDMLAGYWSPSVAWYAVQLAMRTVQMALGQALPAASIDGRDALLAQAFDEYRQLVSRTRLDQTTLSIVREAEARGIPWLRVFPTWLVQLGHGRRLRLANETVTDATPRVATVLARDKHLTALLLDRIGLPTAAGDRAATPEQAQAIAARLGYPVVLKPCTLGKGMGVHAGIRDAAELAAAWQHTRSMASDIRVERHLPGDDHRLLVIDGKLAAAARRIPARVTGDGASSIRQLVEIANRDPRRGTGFEKLMQRIEIDVDLLQALQRQHLTPESVPAAGVTVQLHSTANIATGATAEDVTACLHPDNREVAELAARALHLDIAGVDFISPDISRSWREAGGGIIEVNYTPGLRPHQLADPDSDVVRRVLAWLFPEGAESRVPIAMVTGSVGKTTTAHMLAMILMHTGANVGLCSTVGLHFNRQLLQRGDLAGAGALISILANPAVDFAVAEMARGGLLRAGLGVDRCDVGAVTAIGDDHVGMDGIGSVEEMAALKRMVADAASRGVVLNAEDPLCVQIAAGQADKTVCLTAMSAEAPALVEHLQRGGMAVFHDSARAQLVLARHGERIALARSDGPAFLGGLARHNIRNALVACGMAALLDIAPQSIGAAIEGFRSRFDFVPGRLSVVEGLPFTLILDFGNKAPAVAAVCRLAGELPATGLRRILLVAPANRPDSYFRDIAVAAAAHRFDRYMLTNWPDLRGKPLDHVPGRIAHHLRACGVPGERIEIVSHERDAVGRLLDAAEPGDLVVLMVGDVFAAHEQILGRLAAAGPA